MALAPNNLYSENTRGPLTATQPAEGPGAVGHVAFAGGTETLPVGTPVYMDLATGLYAKVVVGALAATNDIFGIVWPAAIPLVSGSEVLGTVMFRGQVDFNDLVPLQPSVLAGTLQQLKDVCRKPSNRERGIQVVNLDKLGANAGAS